MKHLISATLSLEAGQVWESWPKKNAEANTIGRSATLSMLMVDSGELVLRQKANMLMIGSLRGNIATHRRQLIAFINESTYRTPIEDAHFKMFERIIEEMNDDLDGSIHHDPIKQPSVEQEGPLLSALD